MMLRAVLVGALIAGTGFLSAPAPSHAQGVQLGPDGVRVYGPGRERREERRDRIGRREAEEIARDRGMVEVRGVDRDDDVYIVRGRDRRGDRMRITIDGRSGRVIEVVRRD